jgi:hypothetical protein
LLDRIVSEVVRYVLGYEFDRISWESAPLGKVCA